VEAVKLLWELPLPFVILGGGSNILVSDAGFQGVVVLNRARQVHFDAKRELPTVWAASGANLGLIARQAAARGFSGLEWAAGIPGTIGGAVVGNAGAHGGDMAGNLLMAEILHRSNIDSTLEEKPMNTSDAIQELWPVEHFEYSYRSSSIKRHQHMHKAQEHEGVLVNIPQSQEIIIAAILRLIRASKESIQKKMEENLAFRRRTQPPGASMGSMFKNPPGDYAGRLVEAVGLKGAYRGDAEISQLHGNFFINHGKATANDIWELIQLARQTVKEKFGVSLDLEIELLGAWNWEQIK
jgi:UDP-N-acetylmuramate dehydrogenase